LKVLWKSKRAITKLETILLIALIVVAAFAGYLGYLVSRPPPPLTPEEFELSNLVISSSQVMEGGSLVISVNVTNTGESAITGPITLSLNGEVKETKSVTLEAGEERKVEFTVETSTGWGGDYEVLVGALTGMFSVRSAIKIGWLGALSLQIPLIAVEKQFDEEFGIKLELVKMARAADAMQALLKGDLDITFSALTPVESAFLQGAKAKGIMVAYYGGYKLTLATLDKTGIREVKDLVGKTVAVPGLGAPPELFVRVAANMSGVSPDSIKLVQLSGDVITTSIATGAVDAGFLFEPDLTNFMSKQPGVVVITRGIDIPVINYVPGAYFLREDFIKENSELVYKIFLTLAKAQWYIRTKGPDSDEILSVLSDATNLPAAILKPSANKNIWDPRFKPCLVANAWEEMKFFVSWKKLANMVPISEIWYYGFYERARIEHPELFSDLDDYLKALKTDPAGIVKDADFITDFNEYWATQT